MVDRATRYQNAMNQIQERNKQVQAVEIPDETYERHVKSVGLFIACLCFSAHDVPCVGATTCEDASNR